MKTKRRSCNAVNKFSTKKINTRNMHQTRSSSDDSGLLSFGNSSTVNVSSGKTPNTRAKSVNSTTPAVATLTTTNNTITTTTSSASTKSDPYSFSKADEEDKIPIKRMKIAGKNCKDAAVITCCTETMTDPEFLGPCEPGTPIVLHGIVWLETMTGLLVINVTWRGRTYVGTLLDTTKYDCNSSQNHDNGTKLENHHLNRSNRGKKRTSSVHNHCTPRPASGRHKHRLEELSNSFETGTRRISSRQAQNCLNHLDTNSISAAPSISGESDIDSTKPNLFSKTRSVTRSVAKKSKSEPETSAEESHETSSNKLIRCTKTNCYKKFVNNIAFKYHLLMGHCDKDDDAFNSAINKSKDTNAIEEGRCEIVKQESSCLNSSSFNIMDEEKVANGKGKKESTISTFEFNTDSDDESSNKLKQSTERKDNIYGICKQNNDTMITAAAATIPTEIVNESSSVKVEPTQGRILTSSISPCKTLDLSVKENKVSEHNFENSSDAFPVKPEPTIYTNTNSNISQKAKIHNEESGLVSASLEKMASSCPLLQSLSTSTSPQTVRTVSAPTVSIPCEPISSNSPVSHLNTSINSLPTLIKPKPGQAQITNSFTHSTSRKLKSSKPYPQTNGLPLSFPLPTSPAAAAAAAIAKKRPLVPLKVAVTQNGSSNSTAKLVSTMVSPLGGSSSRTIRSSNISPVTPILPATTTSLTISSSTINSSTINSASVSNVFHNGQLPIKRPSTTSCPTNTVSNITINSLKPIQPKPKSTSINLPVTSSNVNVNPSGYIISQALSSSSPGVQTPFVSHQRQILPNPISKSTSDNISATPDENILQKIETIKPTPLKRKRRRPDKKLKTSCSVDSIKQRHSTLNPIKPKQQNLSEKSFKTINVNCNLGKMNKASSSEHHLLEIDKYKIDEDSTHSPGYSDLSETNDTPAPILEKEIGDGEKLIICTDYDEISNCTINNFLNSEHSDDSKDNSLYNKPPALMPAVSAVDLLSQSNVETDITDNVMLKCQKKRVSSSSSRRSNKNNIEQKPLSLSSSTENLCNKLSAVGNSSTVAFSPINSSRRSFQSSLSSLSNQSSHFPLTKDSSTHNFNNSQKNNKSVVNMYHKNLTTENNRMFSKGSKHLDAKDVDDISRIQLPIPNGKFSVKALTKPPEVISRSVISSANSTDSSNSTTSTISVALLKN